MWANDDAGVFLAVAANVPEWQRDALCAEPAYDPAWWFPDKGAGGAWAPSAVARAKGVCRRCAVQGECLSHALDAGNELPGVWGGASQIDRKQLHRRGVTGDLVRRFRARVDAGRELELDEASLFGGLLEVDD